MSKAELLSSPDFKEYRKLEIKEGVLIIQGLLNNQVTPDYAKGALDMLKNILHIPNHFTLTYKTRQILALEINADFKELELEIVKRFMEDE